MLYTLLVSAMSGLALVQAQSEATPNPTIAATPTSTVGIPTIEGALVYDGPPVIGYTGPGGNATIQSNNPAASYEAVFPSVEFDNATGTTISGSVIAAAAANGTGVAFTINIANLPSPALYGPLVYHIHELPVPSDGNCTGTMGHLDPTQRGELYACEAAAPQTCQAGDLAGKHGNITATTWTVSYTDLYLSTTPGSPYFFGDLSVVIHSSNATRLTCANFTMVSTSNTTTGTTPTVTPFKGAANTIVASASVIGAAALALVVFFLKVDSQSGIIDLRTNPSIIIHVLKCLYCA
ncbi:hypothetical protein MMC13_003276 [Lambiella insularis]|nr:hypothetical protein [Lambiella insularis]